MNSRHHRYLKHWHRKQGVKCCRKGCVFLKGCIQNCAKFGVIVVRNTRIITVRFVSYQQLKSVLDRWGCAFDKEFEFTQNTSECDTILFYASKGWKRLNNLMTEARSHSYTINLLHCSLGNSCYSHPWKGWSKNQN